jgi:hypothetical protein
MGGGDGEADDGGVGHTPSAQLPALPQPPPQQQHQHGGSGKPSTAAAVATAATSSPRRLSHNDTTLSLYAASVGHEGEAAESFPGDGGGGEGGGVLGAGMYPPFALLYPPPLPPLPPPSPSSAFPAATTRHGDAASKMAATAQPFSPPHAAPYAQPPFAAAHPGEHQRVAALVGTLHVGVVWLRARAEQAKAAQAAGTADGGLREGGGASGAHGSASSATGATTIEAGLLADVDLFDTRELPDACAALQQLCDVRSGETGRGERDQLMPPSPTPNFTPPPTPPSPLARS